MRHRRSRYSTPKKGTKQRQLILLMLRPQGVTATEVGRRMGWRAAAFGGNLADIENYGGWDVRRFSIPNPEHDFNQKHSHRTTVAYRIVGRDRWGGGYRSIGVDASSAGR